MTTNSNNDRQTRINNVLWRACDTFRGVVDPSMYKNYILTFLFLKYASDRFEDHKQEIQKKYKDFARVKRELSRERFIVPEQASFEFLVKHRTAANLGELIDKALAALEEENTKLQGIFRDISYNSDSLGKTKDRNRRLANLIDDFSAPELDLRPSKWPGGKVEDVIGNAYMYLISKFAADSGKKGGEFYTPDQVSRLVAKLANPQPGDRICDPASGSCGLLIRAAEEVKDSKGQPSNNFSLYGMESNGETWALGKLNLFLHGFDSDQNHWCNTLLSPALLDGERLAVFDIVVANPPFSLDKWGHEQFSDGRDQYNRFHRGLPPRSKADYAFISHMVEVAKPRSGRVAVIVPHGVLFRGAAEGKIRRALIEENLLDAVIGLPENLFFGTGIPAAILVFDRSREDGGPNQKRKDVVFIDASREFEQGKNQNDLRDSDIAKIVKTYQKRKPVEKYCTIATREQIAENDFNLNIPRYVDTFEEEEEIDLKATRKEIAKLEKDLAASKAKMEGFLKELGV